MRRGRQATFMFRTWGGARKNAGRKPRLVDGRRLHPRSPRPRHRRELPLHITMRLVSGFPSLRRDRIAALVARSIARTIRIRVVEFSLQRDHLHLVAEADDRQELLAGVRGLAISIAKRLNHKLGRSGAVFADRYHLTALQTPTQVRNALVYVLTNARKHRQSRDVIDRYSTGWWFTGWKQTVARPAHDPPTRPPATWLLKTGWRRKGLISVYERPRGS